MRKDTSSITGSILPEHQETISKLGSFHQVNAQLNKVNEEAEVMKQLTRKAVNAEEADFELMISKIKAFKSEDEIKALTEEQIDEIFTTGEGEPIKFHTGKKSTEAEEKELRRDYIGFVYNTEIEMEKLDKAQEELQAMVAESDEEIRGIYESIGGDITAYINNLMQEEQARLVAIEDPTEDDKNKLARIRAVGQKLQESITLDSIINYVNKYDMRNLMDDYKRKSEDIGASYARKAKDLKLTVALTQYRNIEKLFVEDTRLHQHDDLFTFIVMRYLARKKDASVLDGVFISQLAYELRCLYTIDPKKMSNEQLQRRTLLLMNIQTVLGTVYAKLGLL